MTLCHRFFPVPNFLAVFWMFPDVIQHRGLQAAEAEIQCVASRLRGTTLHRRRRIARCSSQLVEDWPTRITEPQQLRYFVVRFASRVVSRTAQLAIHKRLVPVCFASLHLI